MDNTKKKLLGNLLIQAIPSTRIIDRPIKNEAEKIISINEYKRLHHSVNYDSNTQYWKNLFYPCIQDESVNGKLLDFMRNELKEYLDDKDRFWCATIDIVGGHLFSLDELLRDILKIAIIDGISNAVLLFEKCVQEDWIDWQAMVLLSGIKVEREMKIANGIKLVPLPYKSTAELPNILPLGIGSGIQGNGLVFLGKTIIVIDYYATPRFQKHVPSKHTSFQLKRRSTEFPDFDLNNFLNHLSLVSNCSGKKLVEWTYLSEKEPLSSITGCTTYPKDLYVRSHPHSLSASDIVAAKNQYIKFKGFRPDIQEKLNTAINRWKKSKGEGLVDRIIDLGIAFEVIYLDENNKEQLAFTFRLRAAWHLGNDPNERLELLNLFRTIYNCRSHAVHTGRLPPKKKIEIKGNPTEAKELLDKADELCAKAIMKIINDGDFPDWTNLVVGSK